MKVILTANVSKLGQVGDVCDVKPGYGRNYLLPQGMAILASAGAVKQIDDLKRTERRRQDRIRAEMGSLATRMGNQHLTFTAKVGETGRLYGSITAADIAEALGERLGEPVDRRKIILDESIRTLGQHVVPIHLMPGVDAHVTVIVEPEEGYEAPVADEDVAAAEAEMAVETMATPEAEPLEAMAEGVSDPSAVEEA